MDIHPSTALRHRRVTLTRTLSAGDLRLGDPVAAERVVAWVRGGKPLVGRSRGPCDTAHDIPLGLVTVANGVRTRLAVSAPARLVTCIEAPVLLREAALALPPAWRKFSSDFSRRLCAMAGVAPCVYGSAFWQHAGGGEGYLHARSDLDLLIAPPTAEAAAAALELLLATERDAPMRLDGEIELPSGHGVAWRELAGNAARLLVKSDHGPSLWPRAKVWEAWRQAPAVGAGLREQAC